MLSSQLSPSPSPTTTASSVTLILLTLSQQLAVLAGQPTTDIPTDAMALMAGLGRLIAAAASAAPDRLLVLVLDSLDEYVDDLERSDERAGLQAWLPVTLPANVRVVACARSGGAAQQQLAAMLPEDAFLHLGGFSEAESAALLDARLAAAHRRLR